MKNRVRPLTVSPDSQTALITRKGKWRQRILVGAIAPVSIALAPAASAVDREVPPSFSINSDTGTPVFREGLQEGFVAGAANETTPNPFNSSPELTLRMGQSTATGPDAWADNRTWIYTGQIFTGPEGIISIAANNDDFDWFNINGVPVLSNNQWQVTNTALVTGLPKGAWVDFEFRVGNGGGGAGPSGQNLGEDAAANGTGWETDTGVVFSYKDLTITDPLDPNFGFLPLDRFAYDGGRPEEVAGGGPTLFRYQNGLGFEDDLRVTGSGTVTIDGNTPLVTEPSLRFENAAAATLTVNDGTGAHKTLAFSNGTTLASNTAPAVVAGTSDVRLGRITDGALTGVRVVAAGPGRLIIDHVDAASQSDLNGTTLEAGAGGKLTIVGSNSQSPITSLTTPLTISGTGGTINIGSAGAGLSYNNSIAALESGTLEHTTNTADTVGSATSGINVAAGKTLTVKNTANTLTIAGSLTGAAVTNDSTAPVRYTGAVTLDTFTNAGGTTQLRGNTNLANLNVSGGRLEARGNLTVSTVPVIANGATLALLNATNTGTLPNPLTVPTGRLEIVPGALAANAITLTGGTLSLRSTRGSTPGVPQDAGLVGNYYNLSPNNTANQNADFFTYESYTSFFDNLTPTVGGVLTTIGNTDVLSFDPAGGDTAMFSRYGFNFNNQIISRMDGKISIPTAGEYTFSTRSDDGSVIFIDGVKAVDNNFYQGMTTRSGTVSLTAGLHDIDIGFYEEGGGNGLEVFWSGPGIDNTLLSNSVLTANTTSTFSNPVNVQQSSTIESVAAKATISSLTVQPSVTLTTTGSDITAGTLTLNGAGAYTINTAAGATLTANDIASNGAAVNIEKTGSGVFAIDDLTSASPQLPLGSSITVSGGALGVLLGAPTSPLGSATITYAGGGLVLTSKGGNQSFAIPTFGGTGNGSIEARQIASGIAGTPETPIQINLTGSLNVGSAKTVTLGTDDNYVLNLSGVAQGDGTVVVNGGTINDNSGTALQNLNVAFDTNGRRADLKISSNTPTLGSLASDSTGAANVVIGTGSGAATLTFAGAGSGTFIGNLSTAGGTPYSIVKNGSGAQSLVAPLGVTPATTPTALTLNGGSMEVSPDVIGNIPISLAGGTLRMIDNGLTLKIWASDPRTTGAYGATLNTLAGVQAHYASLPLPAFTGNTAANDNMLISYNPGGNDTTPPFGIHDYLELDNIQALMTGKFFVAEAGLYKFSPRSDDGSTVHINGQAVSLNDFAQGINEAAQAPRDGSINLPAGLHDIVITFNEGGGGAGMFVDVTGPDGLRRTLSNTELFTNEVAVANAVNLTSSSGVDAQGGLLQLGTLNWTAGATLTSVSGTTGFATTALPGAGVYTTSGAGNVQPGNITVAGNAAVTLRNAGTGGLILNNTTTAHLQNAASVVSADGGGRIILVTDSAGGATNPLGNAVLRLGGAGGSGELVISTKSGQDFSVNPNLQIDGNILISAGNAGGGAVSGTPGTPIVATMSPAVNYGANSVTFRSNSNYALRVGGAVTGTGPLNVTGGSVVTGAAVNAGAVEVSGGRLTTEGSLGATTATVGANASLQLNGAANVTGGTVVRSGGTLEVNGTSYTGGNISLDGGAIEAVGGVTNLTGIEVNGAAPGSTANSLTARLYAGYSLGQATFGSDQSVLNTLAQRPTATKVLTAQDINFGPLSAGDGAIGSYFGVPGADLNTFTIAFTGRFTAQENGAHSFRESITDDNADFWVDLNQNGVFELNGSSGTERLASQRWGPPNADPTVSVGSSANLVAGQSYRVAMIAEDTGGGGSYAARFSTPTIAEAFVNPGTQTGLWSAETGGGTIRVGAGAELAIGVANNVTQAVFTGDGGILRFNNAAARTTSVELLRSDVSFGTNTIDLGANDTLNAGVVLVNDGVTMRKTGAGTLNTVGIGLATGSTFEVSAGRAIIGGPGVGDGFVVATGSGTAIINGAIAGAVRAETGGVIGGVGSVGNATVTNGTLAPGDNGVGTLTTGILDVTGGTFAIDLLGRLQGDRIAASGFSLGSDVAITLNLGAYNPVVEGPGNFVVLENLGFSPNGGVGDGSDTPGNFLFTYAGNRLANNESFTVNGLELKINYFGRTGNDIVIDVIPEPGTVGALLCGVGSLLSMRLRRRRA